MERNKKIKICYIVSVDMTLKFILLNQLEFLLKEGYNVHAVSSPGKWIKEIEDLGVKIKTISIKRKISPFSDLISIVKLFFYFKKEKFDIVHTHTPKASLLGQLAAKFSGVPIIVDTIHGFYFQKNDAWLKRKFFILINKIAAKCSDLIFFVNKEDMVTAVQEKICRKEIIKYFGGGINIKRFDSARFSREFILKKKKQLGINSEHKIVGIVARLVKEKGYLDLFRAFAKVLKNFPNTTLLVAGSLEPRKKDAITPIVVKRYKIKNNVIFLGERSDVDEIFSLFDIFVLPSYREGLGISIIEASAMEKPVITTDIRGCREAVEEGVTGVLVAIKNPEQIARAIMSLMSNPQKAKEMGEKGREKVIKEFDESIVFDRIKKEYEKLISKKSI